MNNPEQIHRGYKKIQPLNDGDRLLAEALNASWQTLADLYYILGRELFFP